MGTNVTLFYKKGYSMTASDFSRIYCRGHT